VEDNVRPVRVSLALLLAFAASGSFAGVARAESDSGLLNCDENVPICAEPYDSISYEGNYIGHDEPSVLFYDNRPGSGSSATYRVTIPTDPATFPSPGGSTWSFQQRIAFWFGMALCDTQSAPEFTNTCNPASDENIFSGSDPSAPDYIGKHPGAAFVEVQFYPPGWTPFIIGTSCTATQWCASVAIFSFNSNMNTGQVNNASCLNQVGIEPANFAFITTDGVPQTAADPLNPDVVTKFTPDPDHALFMNPGDNITLSMFDTTKGLRVVIHDRTTGANGEMTASKANGFRQVVYAPHAANCKSRPYAFRPMYSTSSEQTRVPWAAHGYNVAYSDEIGHFGYCNTVNPDFTCADSDNPAAHPPCFDASLSLLVPVSGCIGTDTPDFAGLSYLATSWSGNNGSQDRALAPTSILFTSATFDDKLPASGGSGTNYQRVAIEGDQPRIEAADFGGSTPCNRTTGENCFRTPPGAAFYPLFSYAMSRGHCVWQEGGPNIAGTINNLGGTTDQYGPLVQFVYPGAGFTPIFRFNDFRNVMDNPCPY